MLYISSQIIEHENITFADENSSPGKRREIWQGLN
jgi:hypothetical protein